MAFATPDTLDPLTGLPTDPEHVTIVATPTTCEAPTCAVTTTKVTVGSVSGRVWDDVDADGVRDSG